MHLIDKSRRVLAGFAGAVGLALLLPGAAAADWFQPVASPLNANPARRAEVPRMAAIGGVPYVAWRESNGSTDQVRVKKLVGSAWALVGSPLDANTSQYDRYPAIANVGNVPFLAWMQLTGAGPRDQIEVSRFAGSSWNGVGGSLNVDLAQHAENPTIAAIGNVPYVAWHEYNGTANAEQIHVARFDGVNWNPVGVVLNADPNNSAFNPAIGVISGVPYVAWQEFDGSHYQIRVASFNGASWVPVGGVANIHSNEDAEIPSIADVKGVPWISWDEDHGIAHRVHAARLSAGAWKPVGGALNVNPSKGAFEGDIAAINGVAYVAWRDQATEVPQIHVVKRTPAGTWARVGGALNVVPSHDARTPNIIGVNGKPWVTWQEKSGGGVFQIRVKRFENPPDTKISKAQISQTKLTATFKFKSTGLATGLQCRLVSKKQKNPSFKTCRSPKAYKNLSPGKYTFEVRAFGPGGIDATPAKKGFKIKQ